MLREDQPIVEVSLQGKLRAKARAGGLPTHIQARQDVYMTPALALHTLTEQAQAAQRDGLSSLQVDAALLALAKTAVLPETTNPPELAGIPIFLDASGLLVIAGVSLF